MRKPDFTVISVVFSHFAAYTCGINLSTLKRVNHLTPKEKQTCATRAKAARKVQQEELRKKFQGVEYARQLDECYAQLEKIHSELLKAKTNKARLTVKEKEELIIIRNKIEILTAQRDTIRAKIDLNLRRLKFVLPELKSIELSDPNGDNPFQSFTEMLIEATKGTNI